MPKTSILAGCACSAILLCVQTPSYAESEPVVSVQVIQAENAHEAHLAELQKSIAKELADHGLPNVNQKKPLSSREASDTVSQAVASHEQHIEAVKQKLGGNAPIAVSNPVDINSFVEAHNQKLNFLAAYDRGGKRNPTNSSMEQFQNENSVRDLLATITDKSKPILPNQP